MRTAFWAALAASWLLTPAPAPALAQSCPDRAAKRAKSADCAPPRKIEPYDPVRVSAGRTPGFVDLGNGTEVRISGRVRMDYDLRR